MSESAENRLAAGDQEAFGELLACYRKRLRRMVSLRLDARLNGRIDASDVIQEASIEAARRLENWVRDRPLPFFLWLRRLVCDQLLVLTRRHLGTDMRDVQREIPLYASLYSSASSRILADQIVAGITGPQTAVVRAERRRRVQQALDEMEPLDREIIALRSFEQLSRAESAAVLGIDQSAAGKRYLRALKRLKTAVTDADVSGCPDI